MNIDLSWMAAVERYILSRDISRNYIRDLRTMNRRFAEFSANGSPLVVPHVSDHGINSWLDSLKASGMSRKRIYHHRAAVLCVWRDEVARGHVSQEPRFVRKIRPDKKPVICWTLDELSLFIAACEIVPGRMRGQAVTRSTWWKCFGHLAYDTTLRRSDLLTIPWDFLHAETGTVRRVQSKTGNVVTHWLNPATLAMLRQLDQTTPFILTWPYHHSKFDYWMQKIIAAAGIRRGTSKWFRRSGASHAERENPGVASRLLGHTSPKMLDFYLDQSVVNTRPIRPPEIPAITNTRPVTPPEL